MLEKVVFRSVMALFFKALGAIAAFVMNLVLARALGVEQSGYFFLGFTVVTFLSSVTRCGFDIVVLRHTSSAYSKGDSEAVRRIFFLGGGVTFVVSGFVALVLWVGSEYLAYEVFNKPELGPVLKSISPSVLSMALLWLLAQSFQALGKVTAAIVAMNIAANVSLMIFVWWAEGLTGERAAFFYTLGSILILLGFMVFWFSSTNISPHKERYEISFKAMLHSAWPLWIVLVMNQIIQWTGQFVGGAWLAPEEIAQLAVAQRTSVLVGFILVAVNMVIAPRFAALHDSGDQEALKKIAIISVRLMLVGATPVIIVMLLFPKFLMGLFGSDFTGGSTLLQVLALGQFVNVVTGSVGYLLSMSGHERDLRNTLLLVAPVSVVVTFVLVPLYGAIGAAISTALAVGAQNLLAVWFVKRRLGFNTLAVWRT